MESPTDDPETAEMGGATHLKIPTGWSLLHLDVKPGHWAEACLRLSSEPKYTNNSIIVSSQVAWLSYSPVGSELMIDAIGASRRWAVRITPLSPIRGALFTTLFTLRAAVFSPRSSLKFIFAASDHQARLLPLWSAATRLTPKSKPLKLVDLRSTTAVPQCANTIVWRSLPGMKLSQSSEQILLSLFDDPKIQYVSWDETGCVRNVRPRNAAIAQQYCDYLDGAWAMRSTQLGAESSPTEQIDQNRWAQLGALHLSNCTDDTWLHTPIALTRRTHSAPKINKMGTGQSISPARVRTRQIVDATVIIPTRDSPAAIGRCLEGLLASHPRPRQVVIVDHNTTDQDALKIINNFEFPSLNKIVVDGDFNFSRLINLGARKAVSGCLVLLNNDTWHMSPDWLDHLCTWAMKDGIGAAGAELYYPNGELQFLGMVNHPLTGPRHVLNSGGMGVITPRWVSSVRETIAVTGACLATSRELFEQIGGMSTEFPEDYNDVAYCLDAARLGRKSIIVPASKLYHSESETRDVRSQGARTRRQAHLAKLRRLYPEIGRYDPYFSPAYEQNPAAYRRRRFRPSVL